MFVHYIGTMSRDLLTLMDGMELALGFHAANNFSRSLVSNFQIGWPSNTFDIKDVSEPKQVSM
jgi:hypothetical protein